MNRNPLYVLRAVRAWACLVLVGCGGGTAVQPPPSTGVEPPPAEESAAGTAAASHDEHEPRKGGAPAAASGNAEGAVATLPSGPAGADLLSEERAAYERARPVFEAHCVKCHTTSGAHAKKAALKHFSMDTYPFGGHHAHSVTKTIREVLGATGEEPTMPDDDPGAVQGDDLARILSWADAFDRSHAAGLHQHGEEHHEHEHRH